jgi:hypothetical protein
MPNEQSTLNNPTGGGTVNGETHRETSHSNSRGQADQSVSGTTPASSITHEMSDEEKARFGVAGNRRTETS